MTQGYEDGKQIVRRWYEVGERSVRSYGNWCEVGRCPAVEQEDISSCRTRPHVFLSNGATLLLC